MIADWIYDHPTWMWGNVLVWGAAAFACLGLAAFHRFVRVEVRRTHNDLAGFMVAIISVVYAVLLAFIAVATWESFASAETIVEAEAGYICNLYRDTQGFPDTIGAPMRQTLKEYADAVIHAEWPVQRRGERPSSGWRPLRKLHGQLVKFQPDTRGEAVMQAEFLRSLNELYKTREARLTAAAGHIPVVIWWIIGISGALTTAFTYLFGFHSFRMHLTMTGAVAASLALVVVLILALDWPFRGEVSISPTPMSISKTAGNSTPERRSDPGEQERCPVGVTGGCRRQVDGTVDLPSAPEMPCAPRQLRLVSEPDTA